MTDSFNKKELLERVIELNRELPNELLRQAVDLLLGAIGDGLAEGREVCLRGFGRFIPRYYPRAKTKKLGLLFHPSPRLRFKVSEEEEP
ncbi:MAG: HU family DNA-binding protein [Deltaproteobacteria bacterium]|jgi:nucleoid DNA-binding protein|nr:HU family DNA-binding protein [Deltaproteobacteria bacterium]